MVCCLTMGLLDLLQLQGSPGCFDRADQSFDDV